MSLIQVSKSPLIYCCSKEPLFLKFLAELWAHKLLIFQEFTQFKWLTLKWRFRAMLQLKTILITERIPFIKNNNCQ